MKKLISLILLAFISSQMWAVNFTVSVSPQNVATVSGTYNPDKSSNTNISTSTSKTVTFVTYLGFDLTYTITNNSYQFKRWVASTGTISGNRVSANDSYLKYSGGVTVTAEFELIASDVTVAVAYATGSSSTMGDISGGATVAANTNVNLTASANSNYYFKGWSTLQDGSSILSNSNVASYQVSASNTTYYAVFAAYKTSSVSPTGSNNTTNWSSAEVPSGYVDLGLPSGKLWAKKNLGGSDNYSVGNYYAWGSLVAKSSSYNNYFTSEHYPSYANSKNESWTGDATYDAATAADPDHLDYTPTKADFEELIAHTKNYYDGTNKKYYGVQGYVFEDKNNSSNFIYLSTSTGVADGSYNLGAPNYAHYWTSTLKNGTGTGKIPYYYLGGTSYNTVTYDGGGVENAYGKCYYGMVIRPVRNGVAAKVLTIEVKVGDNVVATHTYRCDNGEKVKITASDVEGYEFTNWKDGNSVLSTNATQEFTVTTDKTYTANYTESVSYVTATYKNADNSTNFATKDNVVSGTAPGDPSGTPTKESTNTTVYTFDRWNTAQDGTGNGTDVAISGNTTYYPIFTESTRTYTIRFLNYDGTDVISAITNATYGSTIDAPADNLVKAKPATNTTTYTFNGWNPTVSAVTGDQTYTAQFSESERHYTIRFLNYDGTVLLSDENATYNATVVAPSEDPVRDGYVFTGWNPEITNVSQDQDYIAQFALPQYDLTIGDYSNGTITIEVNGSPAEVVPAEGHTYKCEELTNIIVTATPNKGSHVEWAITGTAQQMGNAIRVNQITGNVTINPTFADNTSFAIDDTWTEGQWKNTENAAIEGNRGQVLDVTLSGRSFTVGQWATLSVPFDCNLDKDDALYGAVYGFSNASMASANSVNIEFIRTYDIKANTPYLIIPRKTVNPVVFYGVTLVAAEDMKAIPLSGTDVDFVSAPWPTTLYNPDFYVSSGTSLRFARTTDNGGTTMNGNRAFFRQTGGSSAPRRVRIVLDGVEVEKEIAEDGSLEDVQNVRKYMENGVLIIECNGIRMDAQGNRIK